MAIRRWIAAADQRLQDRMAAVPHGLDLAMHGLGRAADKGVLWIAVSIGLGVRRDKWTRRAALRGLAGLAIAGSAAKLVRTAAAPSDHAASAAAQAASAAAFATGVALEVPALALPVGGLAALVAASRIATRERSPSEVVAGLALGTAAALVTLRWWPRRSREPAAAVRPRREAPASPSGSGLVLIVNSSAGTASASLAESLGASLPDAEIVLADSDDDLADLISKAAARAQILGIAGGDGSIRLAAGMAVDAGLPLLVVPAGTFNHFAADLGIESPDDALAALGAGDSVLVDVGTADKETFLNTASTGVYVDLVRAREQLEPALGKWPAVLIALIRVLCTGKPVELLADGRRRRVWLLFAGNCRYEPLGAAPAFRPDLADGTFDVRMIDGSQPLARIRLIVAVLLGTLGRCRVYRTWSASSLRVASLSGEPVSLCLDGEAMETKPEVRLLKRPRKLLVYRPASAKPADIP
ncbi:MAG TPA: diacylglycerol kinase family protein [Streptosporangiaceae bacterium]|nr:diacylglycerol kinase family protein [Streptosporangiaceae bacterium]